MSLQANSGGFKYQFSLVFWASDKGLAYSSLPLTLETSAAGHMHGCRISLCPMLEFPSDSWPSGHNNKKSHHLGLAILLACLGICVFQKLDPNKGIDDISGCVEEWAFLSFCFPQTLVRANREIFSFIYLHFLLCPLITVHWKGRQ